MYLLDPIVGEAVEVEAAVMLLIGMAACIAFAAIAFWSTRLGSLTCRECGGGLPVVLVSDANQALVEGEWTCPKCGTRFDRQARARKQ